MSTISQEIKQVIISRLQSAAAAEVLSIASALCEPEPLPFSGGGIGAGGRFAYAGKSGVEDRQTGLIWTKDDISSDRLNWADAKKACAALTLDGFSDWRLPTIQELLTLVDYERHSPAIDKDWFPSCKSDWYWTSTPLASSPGVFAWYVNFYYGGASFSYRGSGGLVRAVRARQ